MPLTYATVVTPPELLLLADLAKEHPGRIKVKHALNSPQNPNVEIAVLGQQLYDYVIFLLLQVRERQREIKTNYNMEPALVRSDFLDAVPLP
jgi:hypothetical protein